MAIGCLPRPGHVQRCSKAVLAAAGMGWFERTRPSRLRADFNGLFGDTLCLSHEGTCPEQHGVPVALRTGMLVTAYDEDSDEQGERDTWWPREGSSRRRTG